VALRAPMPPHVPPACAQVDYLEWIAELPWNVSSPEMLSIGGARRQLEQERGRLMMVAS
jgi:ATP-dependent Lon protease